MAYSHLRKKRISAKERFIRLNLFYRLLGRIPGKDMRSSLKVLFNYISNGKKKTPKKQGGIDIVRHKKYPEMDCNRHILRENLYQN